MYIEIDPPIYFRVNDEAEGKRVDELLIQHGWATGDYHKYQNILHMTQKNIYAHSPFYDHGWNWCYDSDHSKKFLEEYGVKNIGTVVDFENYLNILDGITIQIDELLSLID